MDGFALRAADTPGHVARGGADRAGRACAARARAGRGDGDRDRAGWCPKGPMPSSPSRMLSIMTTTSRFPRLVAGCATFALAAAMCAAGEVVVERRNASGRSAARGARRGRRRRASRAARGRGPPWSRRGPSSGRPGEPLGPGQIYEANGADARRAARVGRRRRRARSPRSPTTRMLTAPRSSAGSRPTSW